MDTLDIFQGVSGGMILELSIVLVCFAGVEAAEDIYPPKCPFGSVGHSSSTSSTPSSPRMALAPETFNSARVLSRESSSSVVGSKLSLGSIGGPGWGDPNSDVFAAAAAAGIETAIETATVTVESWRLKSEDASSEPAGAALGGVTERSEAMESGWALLVSDTVMGWLCTLLSLWLWFSSMDRALSIEYSLGNISESTCVEMPVAGTVACAAFSDILGSSSLLDGSSNNALDTCRVRGNSVEGIMEGSLASADSCVGSWVGSTAGSPRTDPGTDTRESPSVCTPCGTVSKDAIVAGGGAGFEAAYELRVGVFVGVCVPDWLGVVVDVLGTEAGPLEVGV